MEDYAEKEKDKIRGLSDRVSKPEPGNHCRATFTVSNLAEEKSDGGSNKENRKKQDGFVRGPDVRRAKAEE